MDPAGRHHSSQKDRRGGNLSRTQNVLPLAGLVILVESATKSKYGPLLGALATLAWVWFLRVGEVATIRVPDIALPGAIQFWNEGYTTKPLSRYTDQIGEWAHRLVVGSSRKSNILFWQAGESGVEAGMAQCLVGTAYARAR